jgi:hypothetical protein
MEPTETAWGFFDLAWYVASVLVCFVLVIAAGGVVAVTIARVSAYLARLKISDEFAEKKTRVLLHEEHEEFLDSLEYKRKHKSLPGQVASPEGWIETPAKRKRGRPKKQQEVEVYDFTDIG